MARKYFSLVTIESDGKWYPQFGDFNRAVVAQEADDSYWNKNGGDYTKKQMKIIKLADAKQATLDAALAELNGEAK